MKITIITDNPNSWMVPYARELANELSLAGHDVVFTHQYEEIGEGDVLVLLSCERIFKDLHKNKHNLVVHESALPQGKGWSPMTWQILEGKNEIPVTLFEAAEDVDSGEIYLQENIQLEGHELVEELRTKQAETTINLVRRFIQQYPHIKGRPQEGESSFYPRRRPKDSELDISKSIAEQFNLLRVVDNERYPAYFIKDGIRYLVKIEKAASEN